MTLAQRQASEPEHVTKARRKVIVVVPAYNESEKIGEAIAALKSAAVELADDGIDLLVYVVNDGSKDDTASIAKEAGADRVLHHKVNRGLGAAVRTGLSAARDDGADVAIKFDADLQHDPADIPRMLQPIDDDEADVVYGNRFERIEYRMPLVRRTGNLVFTRLMAWLTGWQVRDSQPGIFAVSSAYLSNFYLPGDYNYTQQILLDAYHKGMRFAQVPVAFRERVSGKSFVSFKYPFKVLPQIVMVLVGVRPLRIFAPIGLLFFFGGIILSGVELGMWMFGDAVKPIQHTNLAMGTTLFGVQTLFFGLIADLIVKKGR